MDLIAKLKKIDKDEIFKPIHESFNCEGYYVSNFGRLYSTKSKRFLGQKPRKDILRLN